LSQALGQVGRQGVVRQRNGKEVDHFIPYRYACRSGRIQHTSTRRQVTGYQVNTTIKAPGHPSDAGRPSRGRQLGH
jgi:hypothetical protein